jgi:hypothetical protein
MSLSHESNSRPTTECDSSLVVANFTGLHSTNLMGGKLCQEWQQSIITRQQSITKMRPGTTRKPLNTTKQESTRQQHIMPT